MTAAVSTARFQQLAVQKLSERSEYKRAQVAGLSAVSVRAMLERLVVYVAGEAHW